MNHPTYHRYLILLPGCTDKERPQETPSHFMIPALAEDLSKARERAADMGGVVVSKESEET